MEPQTMVILIILASILILTALDIWNRYKVRRYVRLAWESFPVSPALIKKRV